MLGKDVSWVWMKSMNTARVENCSRENFRMLFRCLHALFVQSSCLNPEISCCKVRSLGGDFVCFSSNGIRPCLQAAFVNASCCS